jgi:hypothetical protein
MILEEKETQPANTRERQMSRVVFSSQSVHWAMPRRVYDALDAEFHFDFDPCPLGESEVDGAAPLFSSWKGRRVFCNPPYNREIIKFLTRASEAEIAVFLLPSRTDTQWFHEFVLPKAREIRFIRGRLKFGEAKNNAPFPSVICIFATP